MCVWMMNKESKGNSRLLAKWFFLKPQIVLKLIENSNMNLPAFVTLLAHKFPLCKAGETFTVFDFKDRKMLFLLLRKLIYRYVQRDYL